MKALLATDLHFTDDEDDAYRWGIIDFLIEQATTHKVNQLFILGDVTDKKNYHSADLVNKVVEAINKLGSHMDVTILKGNHDYIDPNTPFFGFLSTKSIAFVKEIEAYEIEDAYCLFLPHTFNPDEEWDDEVEAAVMNADFVFLHQCIEGSKASNGMPMEGYNSNMFKETEARVYSGDIHVPQVIKGVTYVGSPYHVHFGDSFEPRVMLIDGDTEKDLHFSTISKRTIELHDVEKLRNYYLKPDDRVKVRLKLTKSEFVEWENKKKRIQEICDELGVRLHSTEIIEVKKVVVKDDKDSTEEPQEDKTTLTNAQIFKAFCEKEGIEDDLAGFGEQFMT